MGHVTRAAAAMTHATSACIAGVTRKLQRLPDLTGLKDEVVVPHYCGTYTTTRFAWSA
jgi:hypothetical protein